ncbi:hypothetical protein OROMI_030660 [Orobanche minor]
MKKNANQEKNKQERTHDPKLDCSDSPKGSFTRRSCDHAMTRSPQWSPPVHTNPVSSPLSPLTRSTSRRTVPVRASLLRTMSQINSTDAKSAAAFQRSLSRSASRTGPILYTSSHGLIRPPANEHQLDCTLEELCFGCIKKIKITRDAINRNGQIVQEDETFTIKVKPGWRKGTKITFEGMGNEIPGADPADVIFTISEENHPMFTRKEDDLELKIDIPLVEALTGCNLSVPLLGGQTMSLTINDVINPGYEKIVAGQGMPKQNDPTTRGNLIITFCINFPEDLTDEQRFNAANILRKIR